jgi:deoxyribodipyrimidine photolyase
VRRGPAERVLADLAAEVDAQAVYWNRIYDQGSRERDARLKQAFMARGVAAESLKANLLFEPWEVKTLGGEPFKVFTPFWRACRGLVSPERPLPAPRNLPAPDAWPASDPIASLRLLPGAPDWSGGLGATWAPGEAAAAHRLASFLDGALANYREARDLPAIEGTSRMSPHLAFGEISPRQVWRAVGARWLLRRNRQVPGRVGLARVRLTACCSISATSPSATSGRSSMRSRGPTRTMPSRRGGAAAPAIPSSTRACASSGRPAGCTIACA